MVVKKYFILFIFLGKKSDSHITAAKKSPVTMTVIVRYLCVRGRMKTWGEKGKNTD